MSKVKIQGDPLGSGTITVAAPNTSSDASITLPAITGGEFIVSNASGNVGIGTSSPVVKFTIEDQTRLEFAGLSSTVVYSQALNTARTATAEYRAYGSALAYYTGAAGSQAERMRIDSAGTLILNQGQIQFPATQVPSSNANTLDDYEEGTWAPTFSIGSASTSNFTYTKIGRLVHITGYISSPSGWPSSGEIAIGGLPFVGNASFQMSLLWYNGLSSVIAAAYLPGASSTLQVRPIGGAPNTLTELSVQMTYITN